MKILFSYSNDIKEGFTPQVPMTTSILTDGSVEEIEGLNVLEKVPALIAFIEECYRLLVPGGKCTFTSPLYASTSAWASPLTVRGMSESSLNFADKQWREQYKFSEAQVMCDFAVSGSFAIMQDVMQRSEEVRAFWVNKYNNVAQSIIYTLLKR